MNNLEVKKINDIIKIFEGCIEAKILLKYKNINFKELYLEVKEVNLNLESISE